MIPSVSLVISTYNWPEALELCLKSVINQTVTPQEVIIADDGSGIRTEEIVNSFKLQFNNLNIPLKHIWHEDLGFRKTNILNKAVAEASNEYIVQIDGDVILEANFIKDHLSVAEKETFIRGTRAHLSQKVIGKVFKQKQINFTFLSNGVKHRFNAVRFPRMAWLFTAKKKCSKSVRGCNLAYWRHDFIKINGYNNNLEGWGHEDEEMVSRLVNIGVMKKGLKFKAIQFHIYHPVASKMNQIHHLKTLNSAVVNKTKRCENGYFESLKNDKRPVLELSQY